MDNLTIYEINKYMKLSSIELDSTRIEINYKIDKTSLKFEGDPTIYSDIEKYLSDKIRNI